MDILETINGYLSQIIIIVLIVLLVGGGAFYLMHQRSQLQQSIFNLRRPEINRSFRWQPEVQRPLRIALASRKGALIRSIDASAGWVRSS